MSDNERGTYDEQGGIGTLIKPRIKRPSMYAVVILNDDYTPMEFVVKVIVSVFGYGTDDATRIMLQVHREGKSKIGSFTCEVAETKALLMVEAALKEQHPLKAFVEPV